MFRREIRSASRVTNGDRWRITQIHDTGAVSVVHLDRPGKPVVLPADYVANHVDLGYACTIHRAQGVTAQRAWAMITPQMDRSLAYVAVTRGKESNRILVATDNLIDWDDPAPETVRDADEVLAGVLGRESADAIAATDIAAQAEARERSLPDQIARYRHVLSMVQSDDELIEVIPADWRQRLADDPGWRELATQLRALVDHSDDAQRWVTSSIAAGTLRGAESPARVLAWRLSPIATTATAGHHHLPPPPSHDDTRELAEWLRSQYERVMTLAADAEPQADWRRTTPMAIQDEIAVWRAENEWHHPEQALPAKPPSKPRARQGWRQLRAELAAVAEQDQLSRAETAQSPTPERSALQRLLDRASIADEGLER